MQQHFNENYMESEKYPYATFKGKINEDLDLSKAGVYSVSATGVLNNSWRRSGKETEWKINSWRKVFVA